MLKNLFFTFIGENRRIKTRSGIKSIKSFGRNKIRINEIEKNAPIQALLVKVRSNETKDIVKINVQKSLLNFLSPRILAKEKDMIKRRTPDWVM